ncbi:MAG: ABC transporter permease [Candidatus Solibacter sp.]|nr:ABC transporter permease [Candidatus Solibacter sp.]
MRKILLMAKRDYVESVRTKAFIIGLVVAPLLFGGGFLGIAILKKQPDLHEKRIAVLDRTALVAPALVRAVAEKNAKEAYDKITHAQTAALYVLQAVAPAAGDAEAQRLALSDRVRSRELFAFLEIWPQALHPGRETKPKAPGVAYYTNAGGIDTTRNWLREPLNRAVRSVQLAQLGVEDGHFEDLLTPVAIDPMSLLMRDARTGALQQAKKKDEIADFAAPFGMVLMLIMIVMVGTAPMLSAVTEDKNQRIFEMLLGLATPMELMAARVLAALGRSLTSSAFYICGALLVLQGMAMMGSIPLHLLPWFFVYLVAYVTMLSSFASALGAACNSPQDAQNLATVLVAPIMIPFFVMMPVMTAPNGAMATAMSLFPPFTPVLMLLRQCMPMGVPAWQPWVGLVGILLWTAGITWVAARIFRVGILMQGQPPKLSEIIRWAWAK